MCLVTPTPGGHFTHDFSLTTQVLRETCLAVIHSWFYNNNTFLHITQTHSCDVTCKNFVKIIQSEFGREQIAICIEFEFDVKSSVEWLPDISF